MTYVDSTILNVALPTIQRQLHASLSQLQWVVDAYMVVLASLLLLTGGTADRIGRRKLFCVGLLTFSAGSLLCSLAPSIDALIAFRALQAAGGSMLTPVSLSIVRTTFTEPAERARALGMWSGVFGLATACGPPLGGFLVDLVGWRSVFWVNIPVGIGAYLLARRFVPESVVDRPRRIDAPGQALVAIVLASLTYGIIEGPDLGWSAPVTVGMLALSLCGLVALVVVERHRLEPLLEIRFFRSPPFAGANSIAVLTFTVLAGFLFVNTLYLQDVRGDSALVAGLETLPATALIALSAPVAGWVVARHGPRWPLAVAGVLQAGGAAILLEAGRTTSYGILAIAYVLLGTGFGLINPPITNTAVTSMPPAQAGVASAVTSATRQLGNVLGVAIAGALLSGQIHPHLGALARAPWVLFIACGAGCAVLGLLTTGPRSTAIALEVYSDLGHETARTGTEATAEAGAARPS
jgi:EmrB/QacA subfamily drug resistance transporter